MIGKTANGRWRVRVKYQGRVVADRTFDRRTDASRWEAEQRRQLEQGDWVDPNRAKVTLDELVPGWLEHRRRTVAQRTWESDESAMRLHILPALGGRPVGSISRADVARFAGTLSEGRRPPTVTRVLASLSALMGFLVEDGRIRTNPATGRRAVAPDAAPIKKHEMRPFAVAELLDVVEEQRRFSPREADLTLVLGLTGLRFGELRGLRVADLLDVPYAAFRVSRSVPASGGGGKPIVRERTKSGKARIVPLADFLLPIVRRWADGKQPGDRLFTAPQGGWISLSNWRRSVHWTETGRGRRPHDLRHTAATAWLSAGVDVKTVQAWLGHASAELTLNLYGHHMGTDSDRAGIARINQVLGKTRRTRKRRAGTDDPDAGASGN